MVFLLGPSSNEKRSISKIVIVETKFNSLVQRERMTIQIQKHIQNLLDEARKLKNYEPSEQVDAYFSRLCSYVREDVA